MEIRDVVDSDWAAVWGFLQQIVAAGDTYCWPPDTSEDAARMWWMGKPGGRVLVAVDDGAVVGTAELHPNQPAAGSHVAKSVDGVADRCRQVSGPVDLAANVDQAALTHCRRVPAAVRLRLRYAHQHLAAHRAEVSAM